MLDTVVPLYDRQWYKPSLTDGISRLPPEIALQILSYLSFEDLLSFGATCRLNNEYHVVSLKRLRLGVFEKRRHSRFSKLQAGWDSPEIESPWMKHKSERNYTISVVLQQIKWMRECPRNSCQKIDTKQQPSRLPERPQTLDQMVRVQNQIFVRALRRYGQSLRALEFMAYDLTLDGATALGKSCQHTLRHLALRFEHKFIKDGLINPKLWETPSPASEAWNALVGIGRFKGSGLCTLETLRLERAGITSWQLMMLVKRNPDLRSLKLRTCRGARSEFLYWLGGMENDLDESEDPDGPVPGAKLEVLALENCHRLLEAPIEEDEERPNDVCDAGFEWVRNLRSLQSMSFMDSAHIPSELIDRANKSIWKIPEVILPYSLDDENGPIAVDSKYRVTSRNVAESCLREGL